MPRQPSLKKLLVRALGAAPQPSDRPSTHHRRRLQLEGLERRQLLTADLGLDLDLAPAEPAAEPRGGFVALPNMSVSDAYITDAGGSRIDNPVIGTRVYVQVEFSTINLPSSCSFVTECRYDLQFSIDGDSRWSGPLDWGIGVENSSNWVARLGEWIVRPGTHNVTVQLDATHRISEFVESDNFDSFAFTARSFQSSYGETRFLTPIDGTPNYDYAIVNYVDLHSGSGILDYHEGNYTYNGHNAIDYTVANFARTDIGLPIVAAASGVVSDLNDGEFDRNTCPSICNLAGGNWGNFVTIDHGNGWTTSYIHLRRNSVVVAEGDFIQAGATLGLMGSSGNSSDAHLHFEVRYLGDVVETYISPNSYWNNPMPYAGHTPGVLDHGTTDHDPGFAELKERPADQKVFPATPLAPVHFWVNVHGISHGDRLQFVWKKPDGSTYDVTTYTSEQIRYGWQEDSIFLPLFSNSTGQWTVEFRRNGALLASDTFEVVNTTRDGEYEFDANNYYVTENGGAAQLTVKREGRTGTAWVDYTTLNMTATSGSDYTAQSGTIVFAPGQLERTISIPINNDGLDEPQEKLLVMLSDPAAGTFLGTQWLVGVNIIDNDVLVADFNGDFVIDGQDFLVWQSGFGIVRGATHADGDADRDGDVDGVDFLFWQRLFVNVGDGDGSTSAAGDRDHRSVTRQAVAASAWPLTSDRLEKRERLLDLALTELW